MLEKVYNSILQISQRVMEMIMIKNVILAKAEEIKEELIRIRRDLHAHPETGFQEIRTAALIGEHLKQLGIEVRERVGITGVVGTLRGKYPGKTILLRADMDCLEMQEQNEVDYKSEYAGRMHACGHDAHMTWVLGAAKILAGLKDELHGNVKFLFQPAEETDGGADRMIKEGALEDPKVDAAIGAHVWPTVEAGKIGVKYGPMMASPDLVKITIFGKGGHGAEPHNCVDPISVSCQVYFGFQTIISRRISPVEPAVLTISQINGGTAHNIIPDKVEMVGTVRTFSLEMKEKMRAMMEGVLRSVTEANGATYKFEYLPHYPPVINDEAMTALVEATGKALLGEDNVVKQDRPTMGAEDFSYFQQHVPGAYFIVGTLNAEKGVVKPLHNPQFNIDETILHKTAAVLASCAIAFLNGKQ
jgi:amidohydrolase